MFASVMSKTSEICEVSVDHILGGLRLQALVNARILIVRELRHLGLTNKDIALNVLKAQGSAPLLADIELKSKHIAKLYHAYDARYSTDAHFRLMADEIAQYTRQTIAQRIPKQEPN